MYISVPLSINLTKIHEAETEEGQRNTHRFVSTQRNKESHGKTEDTPFDSYM